MSIRDINPFDWYKSWFNPRRGSSIGGGRFFDEISREFDEMQKSFYDQVRNLQNTAPKDLVKEYETSDGSKVREVGPIVYGYSITVGPDGKPQIREFGNVKSPFSAGRGLFYPQQPSISPEREPLIDISTTDKYLKIVAEMPGVKKENIKINTYDNSVEITTNDPQRKYHKVIEIPNDVDTESAKSTYNNGILEVILNKKKEIKPKGKEIKIE